VNADRLAQALEQARGRGRGGGKVRPRRIDARANGGDSSGDGVASAQPADFAVAMPENLIRLIQPGDHLVDGKIGVPGVGRNGGERGTVGGPPSRSRPNADCLSHRSTSL
jgi:hypothetical protein